MTEPQPRYVAAVKAFEKAPAKSERVITGSAGECQRCGAPFKEWTQRIRGASFVIDGVCSKGHEFHRAGYVSED